MPKSLKLMLTENVESLGIVGDVVNVRTGYARNFLLPRSLATEPSEEAIKAVAAKRADAERLLAEQRKEREATIAKLQGVEVHLTRSCNDMGHLYASITQQDIASALVEQGYTVKPRDIRLHQNIKRVDTYEVHIKFEADLEATIKLWVMADRKLDLGRRSDEGHAEPTAEGAAADGAAEGTDGSKQEGVKPEGAKKEKRGKERPEKEPAEQAEKRPKTGFGSGAAAEAKAAAKGDSPSDKPAKAGKAAGEEKGFGKGKAAADAGADSKPEKAEKAAKGKKA